MVNFPLKSVSFFVLFFMVIVYESLANNDSLYLRSILEKAREYEYSNSDSNNFYSRQLLKESQRLNYQLFVGKAYNQLGAMYKLSGLTDSVLYYYGKATEIAQNNNLKSLLADIYANYSLVYTDLNDYVKALNYAEESIQIKYSISDYTFLEYSYVDIGNIYIELSDYEKALENYHTALKMALQNGNMKGVAGSYINISRVYYEQKKYDEAEFFALKAYNHFNELNDDFGLSFIYQRLASINFSKNNFERALEFSHKVIDVASKINHVVLMANSYELIGNIYFRKNQFEDAKTYYQKSLDLRIESNNLENQINSYINLSRVYFSEKDYTRSKEYLNKSLVMADSLHVMDAYPGIYQNLAATDSAIGNFRSAYSYLLKYKAYSDSLFNDENKQALERYKFQNEFELKEMIQKEEAEEARLMMEHSVRISRLERNGILIFSAIALLVAFIYIRQQRKLKHQQDRLNVLVTKDYELKALQSQINTHFIYNALNGVTSFIYAKTPDKALSYLNKFAQHLRITLENSRDSWVTLSSELESIQCYIELEVIHLDYPPDFQLKISTNVQPQFIFIPPMLIQPLVENAFKHALYANSIDSKLLIEIDKINEKLRISIIDNGPQLKSPVSNSSKGLSLASKITNERVAVINQQFKTDIEFIFSQRQTDIGESTVSELLLPLGRQ